MKFEEDWEDLFDIKIGPFGMGAYFSPRPFKVRLSMTKLIPHPWGQSNSPLLP